MNSQQHYQLFFSPQCTHLLLFFDHKTLSQWEKNQTFPMNLFTFWRFFIKCFSVKTFFLPLFRNSFLLYLTTTFYLLYLSVFIVFLPSATEKPNPMILLLVLSQTLLLTSQLQLIYHSELCRWDGWKQDDFSPYLFLFPLSIKALPLPLSLTPDGIYFVLYIDLNRREEYGCRTLNRCLIFSWFYTSVIYEVSGM